MCWYIKWKNPALVPRHAVFRKGHFSLMTPRQFNRLLCVHTYCDAHTGGLCLIVPSREYTWPTSRGSYSPKVVTVNDQQHSKVQAWLWSGHGGISLHSVLGVWHTCTVYADDADVFERADHSFKCKAVKPARPTCRCWPSCSLHINGLIFSVFHHQHNALSSN